MQIKLRKNILEFSHVLIKQHENAKKIGELMTGMDTDVFIDGKKLEGVQGISFTCRY